jgi:hypothetical protein
MLGQSRKCSNQNPQVGSLFFEGGQERERGGAFNRFGNEKAGSRLNSLATLVHRCAAGADNPRRPRGQSARSADGPDPRCGRSVKTNRTSRDAPAPHQPRGRSAMAWRTVCHDQPDGLAYRRRRPDPPL